jgi:hypothetical protein
MVRVGAVSGSTPTTRARPAKLEHERAGREAELGPIQPDNRGAAGVRADETLDRGDAPRA